MQHTHVKWVEELAWSCTCMFYYQQSWLESYGNKIIHGELLLFLNFSIIHLFLFYVYVCTCVHVWAPHVCSSWRAQKRESDHLELELRVVMSYPTWVPWIELPSSVTAISTLNHKTISPASLLLFLKIPLFCLSLSGNINYKNGKFGWEIWWQSHYLAEVSFYYEIFLDNAFSFQTETQYQLLTVIEVTLGHPTV